MATAESIAIRRADALKRVAKATKTIAANTGAELTDYPAPHKNADMRPAVEAEWLADALESIADATNGAPRDAKPAKDADTADEALAAQDGVQDAPADDVVIDEKPANAKAKKG